MSSAIYPRTLSEVEGSLVQEPGAVRSHRDLKVFRAAKALAMELFELSQGFPKEETYSLTDQIRRSSRAVATSLSEGWQRRRYPAAFLNKLNEAEAEAAETQTWIEFAVECRYLSEAIGSHLADRYEKILHTLSSMALYSESWTKGVARKP